ncbi:MAG: hypothetical protein LBP59_03725 [Planctomycetaceae bacterium]|nr:hypothetical protein [Planctomycetaceae bacterium]
MYLHVVPNGTGKINSYYYNILLVLEIQRFKSVKACRPKARQAKVNENLSTNSLNPSPIP